MCDHYSLFPVSPTLSGNVLLAMSLILIHLYTGELTVIPRWPPCIIKVYSMVFVINITKHIEIRIVKMRKHINTLQVLKYLFLDATYVTQ